MCTGKLSGSVYKNVAPEYVRSLPSSLGSNNLSIAARLLMNCCNKRWVLNRYEDNGVAMGIHTLIDASFLHCWVAILRNVTNKTHLQYYLWYVLSPNAIKRCWRPASNRKSCALLWEEKYCLRVPSFYNQIKDSWVPLFGDDKRQAEQRPILSLHCHCRQAQEAPCKSLCSLLRFLKWRLFGEKLSFFLRCLNTAFQICARRSMTWRSMFLLLTFTSSWALT